MLFIVVELEVQAVEEILLVAVVVQRLKLGRVEEPVGIQSARRR